MKETKAFYLTSEFWLLVIGQIVLTLQTSGAIDLVNKSHAWYSPLLQAVLAAAYMISRGQAKSGVPSGADNQPLPEPTWPDSSSTEVAPGTNVNVSPPS